MGMYIVPFVLLFCWMKLFIVLGVVTGFMLTKLVVELVTGL